MARSLFGSEVAGLPSIDKTESGYGKIQRQVLSLRRAGRLAYGDIADATRWIRKPKSYNGEEEKPAEYDLSNVVAFPGYFCRGKEVLHACIAYKDVDAFAQSVSEKDYARCLQWDRARRARNKKLAQQTGNGAA
jgi:hypothetical protein